MFICAGYSHRRNTAGGRAVAMDTANLSKILDKITFTETTIHSHSHQRRQEENNVSKILMYLQTEMMHFIVKLFTLFTRFVTHCYITVY